MRKEKKNLSKKLIANTIIGVSMSVMSVCLPILEVVSIAESDKISSSPKPLYSLNVNENILKSNVKESSNSEDTIEESSGSTADSSSSTSSEETSSSSSTQESSSNSSTSSSTETTKPSTNETSSSSSSSSTTDASSSRNEDSSTRPDKNSNTSMSKPSSSNSAISSSASPSNASNVKNEKSLINYSRNQTTAEFIEEIGEDAREIGQKNNLYASIMIAQAILESGSGNSSLSRTPNHNLFGIKGSYKNESVEMATLEENSDGGLYTINAKFRKYPSYKESLEDYAMLMSGGISGRSTFYQGAWKSNTSNYQEATKYLTGRYATDSRYHEKLNGLIEAYDLTQYDSKKAKKETIDKTKETENFIKEIAPKIEDVADKNDLYASVLIAEAIIKSNSGNNELMKKHNIYQVTGHSNNQTVKVETLKTDIETKKTTLDLKEYKVYSDNNEAIDDYVAELKKDKTSYQEMTRSKKDTPRKVTAYLTAQNKEDRRYHKRLNGLIDTYNLKQYDKVAKNSDKKEKKSTKSVDVVNELGINMVTQLAESFAPTKLSSLTTTK